MHYYMMKPNNNDKIKSFQFLSVLKTLPNVEWRCHRRWFTFHFARFDQNVKHYIVFRIKWHKTKEDKSRQMTTRKTRARAHTHTSAAFTHKTNWREKKNINEWLQQLHTWMGPKSSRTKYARTAAAAAHRACRAVPCTAAGIVCIRPNCSTLVCLCVWVRVINYFILLISQVETWWSLDKK